MSNDPLIPADQFCAQHNVELSFISTLHESGLINIVTVEHTQFIPEDHLPDLEKLVRLHYDLDINLEGLEAITYLIQRIESLQNELRQTRRQLRLYEVDTAH
ncbi:MAG TPA: chaperone modulator CbpM [Flavitalea sp.]|nr:chaperone modulator CbpM [Flavitalea sp.]